MKLVSMLTTWLILTTTLMAQGYKVGDKAADFKLRNVDGRMISMADYPDAKGFIIIFTCNHCPYSVAYEDRKIALHNQFAPMGYPVIAINPNDSVAQPQDSFSQMKKRAQEKRFPFPYVLDAEQTVYKQYGATRTPHVFLLQKQQAEYIVRYIGAIDNNHEDAVKADQKYVENAIKAIEGGKNPDPDFTRAIGCTIKVRKS